MENRAKIDATRSPYYTNLVGDIGFTIGAEAGNVINVALQLKDYNSNNLAVRGSIRAYLSDDANGDSVVATAPSSGIAIGTNGLAMEEVADKVMTLVSEAAGTIDLNITEAGVKTCYLICILPDGTLKPSGAITFA